MLHIREEPTGKEIKDSKQAYEELKELGLLDQETFFVLGLDGAHRLVMKEMIFQGGINFASIDVRVIFKRLLMKSCTAFIAAHNHPSGSQQASIVDIAVTKKLKEAGTLLEINLLDHLIITREGYTSLNNS